MMTLTTNLIPTPLNATTLDQVHPTTPPHHPQGNGRTRHSAREARADRPIDEPLWTPDVEQARRPDTIGLTPPSGDVDASVAGTDHWERRTELTAAVIVSFVLAGLMLPALAFVTLIIAEWQAVKAVVNRRHLRSRHWRRAMIGWAIAAIASLALLPLYVLATASNAYGTVGQLYEQSMYTLASVSGFVNFAVVLTAAAAIATTLTRYAWGESAWRVRRSLLLWSATALLSILTSEGLAMIG
ncbi:MAG: hypothetical protein GC159_23020 [Phycisphaera sp.]|nr:hypothetical protein [Phycisphaera sp.]